jgi:hypothetical protein
MMRPLAKNLADIFLVNDIAHRVRVSWFQGGQQNLVQTCLDAFLRFYCVDRPIAQRYLELIVVSVREQMSNDKLLQLLTRVPECIGIHMIHPSGHNQDISSVHDEQVNARITARSILHGSLKDSLLDVAGEINDWHEEKRLHGAATWLLSSDAAKK